MRTDWPIDYRSNKAWRSCDDLAVLVTLHGLVKHWDGQVEQKRE